MANGNGLEPGIRDASRQQQLTPGGESSITGREPSLRGNVPAQKLTIGLDLGDRSSWYCLLDEVGEILLEEKLNTTPKAMKEVFGTMPRCRIALQTGMHSPWVSRALSELGHEVIVAHARNVRLIGESRKKDDRMDAQTLARLARIDPQLLCPVKLRSAKAQADLTAHFHHADGNERSIIRWQHRLKREHPTCTERTSLNKECGWKGGDSGDSAGRNLVQPKNERNHLTPTGLLMEGVYTQNHSGQVNDCNHDFA